MDDSDKKKLDELHKLVVIGFTRLGLNAQGEPVNGLFTRMDKQDASINEVKEQLKGNVTTHTLKTWIITSSSILGAVIFLANLFGKILK